MILQVLCQGIEQFAQVWPEPGPGRDIVTVREPLTGSCWEMDLLVHGIPLLLHECIEQFAQVSCWAA